MSSRESVCLQPCTAITSCCFGSSCKRCGCCHALGRSYKSMPQRMPVIPSALCFSRMATSQVSVPTLDLHSGCCMLLTQPIAYADRCLHHQQEASGLHIGLHGIAFEILWALHESPKHMYAYRKAVLQSAGICRTMTQGRTQLWLKALWSTTSQL